jgi:hypothetical protein
MLLPRTAAVCTPVCKTRDTTRRCSDVTPVHSTCNTQCTHTHTHTHTHTVTQHAHTHTVTQHTHGHKYHNTHREHVDEPTLSATLTTDLSPQHNRPSLSGGSQAVDDTLNVMWELCNVRAPTSTVRPEHTQAHMTATPSTDGETTPSAAPLLSAALNSRSRTVTLAPGAALTRSSATSSHAYRRDAAGTSS